MGQPHWRKQHGVSRTEDFFLATTVGRWKNGNVAKGDLQTRDENVGAEQLTTYVDLVIQSLIPGRTGFFIFIFIFIFIFSF